MFLKLTVLVKAPKQKKIIHTNKDFQSIFDSFKDIKKSFFFRFKVCFITKCR